MIVARFKVRCVPATTEEMLQVMRAAVAPSRALPGVIHFDAARDVTDIDSLIATEVFEDRMALERQNAQPELAAVMKLIEEGALSMAPEWTIYSSSHDSRSIVRGGGNTYGQTTRVQKYLPLEEWFRNQLTTPEQIELTLDQVAAILGPPLPKSATKPTWRTNVQPKIQSHRTAWLNNGWKVAEFDQQTRWLRFVRA